MEYGIGREEKKQKVVAVVLWTPELRSSSSQRDLGLRDLHGEAQHQKAQISL